MGCLQLHPPWWREHAARVCCLVLWCHWYFETAPTYKPDLDLRPGLDTENHSRKSWFEPRLLIFTDPECTGCLSGCPGCNKHFPLYWWDRIIQESITSGPEDTQRREQPAKCSHQFSTSSHQFSTLLIGFFCLQLKATWSFYAFLWRKKPFGTWSFLPARCLSTEIKLQSSFW